MYLESLRVAPHHSFAFCIDHPGLVIIVGNRGADYSSRLGVALAAVSILIGSCAADNEIDKFSPHIAG